MPWRCQFARRFRSARKMTETADVIATVTEVRFHTGYSHVKNQRKYYVKDAGVHFSSALSREDET